MTPVRKKTKTLLLLHEAGATWGWMQPNYSLIYKLHLLSAGEESGPCVYTGLTLPGALSCDFIYFSLNPIR